MDALCLGMEQSLETVECSVVLLIMNAHQDAGAECPTPSFPPLFAAAELVKALVAAPTKKERMKLPGMTEKREDVITAGAVLLLELFDALGIKEMMVRHGPDGPILLTTSMNPLPTLCPSETPPLECTAAGLPYGSP